MSRKLTGTVEAALVLDETKEILKADTNSLFHVIKLSQEHQLPQVTALAEKWLGAYFLKEASFSRAVQYYQAALMKVDNLNGFYHEKFIIQTGIANGYIGIGRYADAEKLNLKLLNDIGEWPSTNKQDSFYIINSKKTVLQNLSYIYLGLGKYNEAIPMIKEAKALIKRNQYSSDEAYEAAKIVSVFNLGTAYLMKGDGKSAKPFIVENLNYVKEQNNDPKKLARCYGNLAYCEHLLHDYKSAYAYYFESLKISESNNYPDVSLVTYKDLSDTYRANGKWKESMRFLNNHYLLKDSIQGIAVQRNLDELRVEFETQQKEEEILKLNNERKLAQQQRLLLLAALALAVLIGLLVLLYFLNQSKIRKKVMELDSLRITNLNQELKFKEQDVTRLALEISKKQELALQLSDQFKELDSHINPEARTKWRNMRSLINGYLQDKDEQQVFYQNVDMINHAFYDKLLKQFPNLNKAERELCSYIKLGLSNKEISILRNVSTEAIRSSRFRLRNKLNLSSKEEVEIFLHKL